MKKKLIILLFFNSLLFILFSYKHVDAYGFPGGDGLTSETSYQIKSCEDLQAITGVGRGFYFSLENNIDCSDTVNWNDGAGFIPIGYTYDNESGGYGEKGFSLDFDGNGYTISGLYINLPTYDYVGLFGGVGYADLPTNIRDVKLDNFSIVGNDYVGGLIGRISNANIENISTSGNIVGNDYVGGLIGEIIEFVEIIDSYSEISANGDENVGGLVGLSDGGFISGAYSVGDINGRQNVGGLVGWLYSGENLSSIINTYSTSDVSGEDTVGGLIGYNERGYVYNSYSIGSVSGDIYTGGVIGAIDYLDGEDYTDFVFNMGWYRRQSNDDLSAIGEIYYYSAEHGDIYGGPQNVSYTESDPTAFYSSNHDIYKNAVEYDWEFNGNPWYEYSDDYPKFTEPDSNSKPSHSRVRSSGSSVGAISTFYQEQYQRALAVGADTTPYQEALNNLNPSTSSGQAPSTSSGQTTLSNTDQDHRTLKQGMQGNDVKQLQIYLNTHNYPLASTGIGSPNNETTYFGKLTKQAVILFQKANNLTPDGVVGPLTRGKMN